MMVGVCRLELRLPENHSLKGKRQVVQSVIARLQNKFGLAVAEVDNNDVWQIASLGLACVSASSAHAEEVLANAVRFVEETRPDLEVLETEIEILQGF